MFGWMRITCRFRGPCSSGLHGDGCIPEVSCASPPNAFVGLGAVGVPPGTPALVAVSQIGRAHV